MSRKQPEQPQKQLTRKQLSRRAQEARLRKWLIIGTSTVLALVVLVLGWGLYQQYVVRPRQPVATVYGVPVTLREYQKLFRFRRWDWANRVERLESQKQQLSSSGQDAPVSCFNTSTNRFSRYRPSKQTLLRPSWTK